MLINNYMCNINFSEVDCKRPAQHFLMKLLDKNPKTRPTAKQVLEDDIFSIAESNIGINLDFMNEKYIGSGKFEADGYKARTKAELESMFKMPTTFSILDSRDMIHSHRSDMNEVKSFMMRHLKTAKHSRFSNQLDRNDSAMYSSYGKSSNFNISNKVKTPNSQHRYTSEGNEDELLENVASELAEDEHPVCELMSNYVF